MKMPKNRKPTHPSVFLRAYLEELELSQRKFAEYVNWPLPRVNQLCQGKRSFTPETALVLADVFNTTPDFWLNAQKKVNLWEAQQSHKKIHPLRQAS